MFPHEYAYTSKVVAFVIERYVSTFLLNGACDLCIIKDNTRKRILGIINTMSGALKVKQRDDLLTIKFDSELIQIGPWTILRLPETASAKLPSKGQVMVEGSINGVELKTPLEPDGKWSHWLKVDDALLKTMHAEVGDTVTLSIKSTKDWVEPEVPADLMSVVKANTKAYALWQQITPLARWDWIRWMRATNNIETRNRRIEVACSKLSSGMRRPCCFNRNMCSEPLVSKNGVLIDPS